MGGHRGDVGWGLDAWGQYGALEAGCCGAWVGCSCFWDGLDEFLGEVGVECYLWCLNNDHGKRAEEFSCRQLVPFLGPEGDKSSAGGIVRTASTKTHVWCGYKTASWTSPVEIQKKVLDSLVRINTFGTLQSRVQHPKSIKHKSLPRHVHWTESPPPSPQIPQTKCTLMTSSPHPEQQAQNRVTIKTCGLSNKRRDGMLNGNEGGI